MTELNMEKLEALAGKVVEDAAASLGTFTSLRRKKQLTCTKHKNYALTVCPTSINISPQITIGNLPKMIFGKLTLIMIIVFKQAFVKMQI